MWQQLRSSLFGGMMVILPLLVTVYLIQLVFGIIDRAAGGWLTRFLLSIGWAYQQDGHIWFLGLPFHDRVPLLGLLLVVVILLLFGGLARTVVGRFVLGGIERFVSFIPVARGIYSTVQQVSQAFVHGSSTFKQVVLVEYPREGLYTVGFVTGESQGETLAFTGRTYVNVFLPKSPNPTNGWLVLVPKDDVIYLDIPVEEGLKFVVSAGVVSPQASPAQGIHLTVKKEGDLT
jgi:uncharacterized membrane protein